jgi:hypothetical protein
MSAHTSSSARGASLEHVAVSIHLAISKHSPSVLAESMDWHFDRPKVTYNNQGSKI